MTTEIDPTKDWPNMPDNSSPATSQLPPALDKLTEAQREKVVRVAQDMHARSAAPSMTLTLKDDHLTINLGGPNAEVATLLQMSDIGTVDADFHKGLIGQIASVGSHSRSVDSDSSNFVLAVVRSVQPRDELEAMLATQMGAVHAATMMFARRLNLVETIPQQDSAERALNKLARTFANQMEALKRYRTGGQQKVTVEHVTVNSGGQAIVGAVEGGGGRK